MSTYPSESECIDILRNAGCEKRVIVHCCTVRTVAEQFMKKIKCDRDVVIAGSMLHDIGRAKDHSIFHAAIGADMAANLGLPSKIVDIIRKHTGAGLDFQDVMDMGLPPGDYMPSTIEEKIVAHSDNMVSDNSVVPHIYSVNKLVKKGIIRGAFRIQSLHSELSNIYGTDLDAIVNILGEHPVLVGPCGHIVDRYQW
ncbi:MAG: HDIG domain-containing protein [archaeon]|nr:HDIG domain-containing protein [archaeon]